MLVEVRRVWRVVSKCPGECSPRDCLLQTLSVGMQPCAATVCRCGRIHNHTAPDNNKPHE